jgi:DeoR family transcriptional regulator of aga operon
MLRSQRRANILHMIREQGFVASEDLAQVFGVTLATIRRDLKALSRQDLITLDHGGAADKGYLDRFVEPLYVTKTNLNMCQKQAIGKLAADLIESGDSFILDSGTTSWQVAASLRRRGLKNLTCFTGDIQVALELCSEPNVELVLIGGSVRRSFYYSYGSYAECVLQDIKARKFFMGTDAASIGRGVSTSFLPEARLKQLMMQACDCVILIADSTKLGQDAPYRVGEWSAIDQVITDDGITDKWREFFASNHIKLLVAHQATKDDRSHQASPATVITQHLGAPDSGQYASDEHTGQPTEE